MAATNADVTGSASIIVAASASGRRISLKIYNNSDITVYLGEGSTVTADNGFPLFQGEEISFDYEGEKYQFLYRGAVWGITNAGTADVRYWEFLEFRT